MGEKLYLNGSSIIQICPFLFQLWNLILILNEWFFLFIFWFVAHLPQAVITAGLLWPCFCHLRCSFCSDSAHQILIESLKSWIRLFSTGHTENGTVPVRWRLRTTCGTKNGGVLQVPSRSMTLRYLASFPGTNYAWSKLCACWGSLLFFTL